MPKFKVRVNREEIRSHVFEVEADNEDAAADIVEFDELPNFNWLKETSVSLGDENVVCIEIDEAD